MTPHGPEADVFEKATNGELEPQRYEDTMAFMFESRYVIAPTQFALETSAKQKDYLGCWGTLKKYFNGEK